MNDNMLPKDLFKRMSEYYGPQNWWPGEDFEIAIGAILTQNTSWSNVELAIANLKANGLLTPQKILETETSKLKELITPTGFFNQKTEYLKNLCNLWIRNSKPSRDELLNVKGVGEETADSILLYLLEQPEFVIDAYTIRISTRLGYSESKKKSYWKEFYESALDKNVELFNEFHALFVIHAKQFCKKNNPLCNSCFLNDVCDYGKGKIDF